jgi:hypothetical protein
MHTDVLRHHAFHADASESGKAAATGLVREESVSSALAEDAGDLRAPSEVRLRLRLASFI